MKTTPWTESHTADVAEAVPEQPEATPGEDIDESPGFDFDAHRQQAVEGYQPRESLYADFARAVYSILSTCLDNDGIKVHSVDHRAKSIESFGRKAAQAADDNPNRPKYQDPLREITDLAGARIITYFPSTEARVRPIIYGEFDVIEETDRSELLQQEERLGYHSIHYLVKLRQNRCALPEYARFDRLVAEIQVRTILQHAWAEIEHDIQYKAVATLPIEIRRRFMTLAGLLEIADREFQAIEDEDVRLRDEARASVEAGRLGEVEITPDAVKSYLDKKYGSDGRMSDFSYRWEARLLRRLGFTDLEQLDLAISPFNDDQISRVIHGSRQGQLTRLEDVLLAAMGEEFISRHPWANDEDSQWYYRTLSARLRKLRENGVDVSDFRPEDHPSSAR